MEVVDYILEGLEAALELERELGVRAVECDRAVLGGEPRPAGGAGMSSVSGDSRSPIRSRGSIGSGVQPVVVPQNLKTSKPQKSIDLCFLHDRPLSPDGAAMMAKIIGALHRTAESAPIVIAPQLPQARVIVVLGGRALKRYFPEQKAGPGQWFKTPGGRDVLVTYSPDYILRFGEVTPAVQKMKREMWTSLKAVAQRCGT